MSRVSKFHVSSTLNSNIASTTLTKSLGDLVAQTIGKGITEGAIVQHLSKLRGKMVENKLSVPPTLRRGVVAKEPSKIYATSNGKKLPPPVFAPITPVQAKKPVTPKSQTTSRSKSATKTKGKRVRSELYDSDEEDFDDFVGDSDEEYGISKKKTRTPKPKTKEVNASVSKKPKIIQAESYAADLKDIEQDILATLGDGGPASRTRHIKQDFSNLEAQLTDEEEDEDEEESGNALGDFKMPDMYSAHIPKQERSVSPFTVDPKLAAQKMVSIGSSSGVNNIIPAYAQVSGSNALITPQQSRNASTASYNTSLYSTPFQPTFNDNVLAPDAYDRISGNALGLSPVDYSGIQNPLSTFNSGIDDLGLGLEHGGFDPNAPLPSAGLEDPFGDGYQMDDSIFDQFTY